MQTAIIGGGQAGLALSYFLTEAGKDHIILERASGPAFPWREERWDSFALNTPNWTVRMPGMRYDGPEPDGFLSRLDIVDYFERYIDRFDLPVYYDTSVTSVELDEQGNGYHIKGEGGMELYQAENVVIATGLFQKPKIPSYSQEIPPEILQIHSSQYKNPELLPPGAVLVVGAGQSGCQIAEELYQSGRKVFLCVGNAPRVPRRYRGRDMVGWLEMTGFFDRTIEQLPSPQARFAANPQISGTNGGHSINLHQFARDGVTLLGRIAAASDGCIALAPGLHETLAKSDKAEADALRMVDAYILKNGLSAPLEELPQLRDGFNCQELTELNLAAAGISTVIWSAGYDFSFDLVKLPVVDDMGYPLQQRGVTRFPGLYFLGLNWLHKFKSGLLLGVGEDADYLASRITSST